VSSPRPPATVSVDVDPLDLHLAGYGVRGAAPDPLVYQRSVPRLLELFAEARIRATFFFVARDFPEQNAAAKAVARAGHEVASHSLTHPMPFRKLGKAALAAEIVESKRRLEEACGAEVVGFRAPNWDMTERELPALLEAGYRYDASNYPSPFLLLARGLLAAKGTPGAFLALTKFPVSWRRGPYAIESAGRRIVEFPISTTGLWRFPVYQTVFFGFSDAKIAGILAGIAARGERLSFALHAVDALGAGDGVDPRLARHPGVAWPLERKLGFLRRVFGGIAGRFDAVPFREREECRGGP
jgi:hypothetical protein